MNISDAVHEYYTDALRTAGSDGTDLDDLRTVVVARVKALHGLGEITIDIERVARAELDSVDRGESKQSDKVIALFRDGYSPLDFDVDAVLDLSVTLGGGRRKLWRHVDAEDLAQMDELRYRNVRSAQTAYEDWRQAYVPLQAILRRYETVADAARAGEFSHLAEAA